MSVNIIVKNNYKLNAKYICH